MDIIAHLNEGGKMMVTLSWRNEYSRVRENRLAEMIQPREGSDIISCTGANLEEDIMNLVAH
jgi:hypothetical protein